MGNTAKDLTEIALRQQEFLQNLSELMTLTSQAKEMGTVTLEIGLMKAAEGVTPSADDQNMLFDLQFDHILAELSEINKTADDVVQSNIEALGAISASGERIDRLNRDNEHSLAKLVTGSVA